MIPLREALLARRSVRRYSNRPVEPDKLGRIQEFVAQVEPLVPSLQFTCSVRAVTQGDELTVAAGAYGRIVAAPFLLVPAIQDCPCSLVDFGFRVEQLVIRLTQLGLGSCWVGALRHESDAARHFGLPRGWRIGAVVAFGYESTGAGGRFINATIRSAVGASRPLPFDRFVSDGRFGAPAAPTEPQVKILDALRRAPSTGNARPWHVVLTDGVMYLAVRADAPYYRASADIGYHLIDAGIGMANVSLALESEGRPAGWLLTEDAAAVRSRLDLPTNFLPVASITLPA